MSGSEEIDPQERPASARELLRASPPELALPDFAALEAQLDTQLAAERGPRAFLRALSTPRRLALLLLALAALAVFTALARARVDLAVYPAARMALVQCVVGVLVLFSLVVALWPLPWRPIPDALRKLSIALGPLALLALYSLPAAHSAHPASVAAHGGAALLARAAPCLLIGSGVAAAAFLLFHAFDRGAQRVSPLLAVGAGLYANFLLQLHCAVTAPSHMLLGHLGVVVLALSAVLLVGHLRSR